MTSQVTAREGRPALDGPHEGVPSWMRAGLIRWLVNAYRLPWLDSQMDEVALEDLATLLHIDVRGAVGARMLFDIIRWADQDDERFLDLLHYTLQLPSRKTEVWESLEGRLALGNSAWQATENGLRRRNDATARAIAEIAVRPNDAASTELAEAYSKAYDRHGDPSDAWDHAIKAVEAVLIPIVVPGQDSAHMGHVLGQLDNHGEQWTTLLRFNQLKPFKNPPFTSVQALVGMLRLIYPNPDRHVDPDHRTPTLEEARAVVQLAVTIVQWGRDGNVVRR